METGFSRRTGGDRERQPVAITAVDPARRTATGMTRLRSTIQINCAYATGDTITVPSVGEQWYVERFMMEWRLHGRIPFNDATLNIEPVAGQVSVGSATGPLELNGTEVRANGTLRLGGFYYRDDGTTLQRSTDGTDWHPITAEVTTASRQDIIGAAAVQASEAINAPLAGVTDMINDNITIVNQNTDLAKADAASAVTNTGLLVDHVTNTFTGSVAQPNRTLSQALDALRQTYSTLGNHSTAIQALQAKRNRDIGKGSVTDISFANYPDRDGLEGFTITYIGPGTSKIGTTDGLACWRNTNNADLDAYIINDSPTYTDFQVLRGTMSQPPESAVGGGTPKFHAIGRVSADRRSFVWARVYSTGSWLQFRAEIGCTVDGTEKTWASNIPLTWALDMTFYLGVGTEPRQYQVYSGDRLVWQHTESGANGGSGNFSTSTVDSYYGDTWKISSSNAFTLTYQGATTSSLSSSVTAVDLKAALDGLGKGTWTLARTTNGPWYLRPPATAPASSVLTGDATISRENHRKWGSISQIRSGTNSPRTSGKLGGCAVADNITSAVNGSTARLVRTDTTFADNWTFPGSSDLVLDDFWESVSYESPDIDADTTTGTFTVTESKPYVLTARVPLATGPAITSVGHLVLQVSTDSGASWSSVQWGPSCDVAANRSLFGSWIQYLGAGNRIRLMARHNGTNASNCLTGGGGGTGSYFTVVGIG
jgi:hypothetical protein